MRFPTSLPENQEDKRILGEFYDLNVQAQWFDMALLVENHQSTMKKTLVLFVNYTPSLAMKDILAFTHKYNLALDIKDKQHKD